MDFDKTLEVTNALTAIEKILKTKANIFMDTNDGKNILAGIYFEEQYNIDKINVKILKEFKKLEKSFDINHIVINKKQVIFQGTLKNGGKK